MPLGLQSKDPPPPPPPPTIRILKCQLWLRYKCFQESPVYIPLFKMTHAMVLNGGERGMKQSACVTERCCKMLINLDVHYTFQLCQSKLSHLILHKHKFGLPRHQLTFHVVKYPWVRPRSIGSPRDQNTQQC